MQTSSRRLAIVATLGLAVAALAAAFGPVRSQINQAPTPIIRDLPAAQPVRIGLYPPDPPVIRGLAGWVPVHVGLDPADPPTVRD